MLGVSGLLGQNRPSDTTAVAVVTNENLPVIEITAICVCNSTGSAATFRIHHDVAGSTYDESNALYFDKSVPANDSLWIRAESMGAGISLAKSDTLGVRSDTGDALTFSVYGAGAQIAKSQIVRN